MHRFPPDRLIAFQVLQGNDATAPLHLGNDEFGGFTLVKAIPAFFCNALQRSRQVRLLPDVPFPHFTSVDAELLQGCREISHAFTGAIDIPGQVVIQRESGRCQANRRRYHLLTGQGAMSFQQVEQPSHAARHACGQVRIPG